MGILRGLFGSLTSGVVRLAVFAGVLLLCYLLIVKPVLKTTEGAIHSTGIDQIGKTLDGVSREVQQEVRRAFKETKKHGGHPRRLLHCVKQARGDTHKIQRCAAKF